MSDAALDVELRNQTGKGVARRLRAEGKAPAVLYGQGKQPVSLAFNARALERILRSSHSGMNTLIDLRGESSVAGRTVMVRELQREPVRGQVMHADLFEVAANETLSVSVPVHVRGVPKGVSLAGGVLDHVTREIELECLPRAIPDEIVVDVSELEVGDSLHVRDLQLPDGVELLSDADLTIVAVAAASVEEAAAPVEAAEAAEVAAAATAKAEEG